MLFSNAWRFLIRNERKDYENAGSKIYFKWRLKSKVFSSNKKIVNDLKMPLNFLLPFRTPSFNQKPLTPSQKNCQKNSSPFNLFYDIFHEFNNREKSRGVENNFTAVKGTTHCRHTGMTQNELQYQTF